MRVKIDITIEQLAVKETAKRNVSCEHQVSLILVQPNYETRSLQQNIKIKDGSTTNPLFKNSSQLQNQSADTTSCDSLSRADNIYTFSAPLYTPAETHIFKTVVEGDFYLIAEVITTEKPGLLEKVLSGIYGAIATGGIGILTGGLSGAIGGTIAPAIIDKIGGLGDNLSISAGNDHVSSIGLGQIDLSRFSSEPPKEERICIPLFIPNEVYLPYKKAALPSAATGNLSYTIHDIKLHEGDFNGILKLGIKTTA
jgi:hypothetical protein